MSHPFCCSLVKTDVHVGDLWEMKIQVAVRQQTLDWALESAECEKMPEGIAYYLRNAAGLRHHSKPNMLNTT